MKAKGPNMRVRMTTVSAWTANALAWGGGAWLWFGPSYRGVSVTPVLPGGSGGEVTQFTATLVEVNGVDVVLWLLVPVLVTIIALLAVHLVNPGQLKRKIILWCTGLALLSFCMLAIFSFGILYLPAALALLVAAVADSMPRRWLQPRA